MANKCKDCACFSCEKDINGECVRCEDCIHGELLEKECSKEKDK